jgi:squalene synthase HpnC
MTTPPASAAPAAAAVMAQAGEENFPVASRVLPAAERADLLAVYGYARLVDDIGDEAAGDRGALLDEVEADLARIYAGSSPEHPLLRRVAATIHARAIPRDPFQRLIEANRQDQVVATYADLAALAGYCHLSANPVGEIVLHVFGAATPERIAWSDAICTALQLAEHLQDVAEDRRAGRVYLPQRDLERFGCPVGDLDAPSASPALRAVMAYEVGVARRMLTAGSPLLRTLPPRAALAVAAFVAGGRAALDAVERVGYDVLAHRAKAGRAGLAWSLARTLAGVAA